VRDVVVTAGVDGVDVVVLDISVDGVVWDVWTVGSCKEANLGLKLLLLDLRLEELLLLR